MTLHHIPITCFHTQNFNCLNLSLKRIKILGPFNELEKVGVKVVENFILSLRKEYPNNFLKLFYSIKFVNIIDHTSEFFIILVPKIRTKSKDRDNRHIGTRSTKIKRTTHRPCKIQILTIITI